MWYEGVKQIGQKFQGILIIVLTTISVFKNQFLTNRSSIINRYPYLADMNKRMTQWTTKWEIMILWNWNLVRWSILMWRFRFRQVFLKLTLSSLFIHEKGHLSKSLITCVFKVGKCWNYLSRQIFSPGIHFWAPILKLITSRLIMHSWVTHWWHPVKNLSNIIRKS